MITATHRIAPRRYAPLRRAPQRNATSLSMEFTMSRKMYEQSAETAAIAEITKAAPIGATVTYADVEARTGPFPKHAYQSAVRVARRAGVIVATVRGVGFVRLEPGQIVDRQASHMRSIRRKGRIVQSEVETAVRGNLSHRDQIRATTLHAAAGVIVNAAVMPRSNSQPVETPPFVTPQQLERGARA